MSDPVTNVEIEDVLSSIRRLVAEGGRKDSGSDSVDSVPEKLVLTPALRVMTDNTLPKPKIEPKAAEEPTADSLAGHSGLTADTIAELEEAVTAQPDEWEPDGSEVKTEPTWESAGFDQIPDAEIVPEGEEAARRDPAGDANEPLELTAHAIPAETTATDQDDPMTGAEAANAIPPTFNRAAPQQATQSDGPEAAAKTSPDVADISFPRAARDVEEAIRFATRITNPHLSAVAEPTFRHVPSEPDDTDYGDELAAGPADPLAQDEDLDAYLSDGAILDEATLRALITDVLAQELQGKLGERISRNVRKLVRREIHRMLTSQELD